MIAVVDYKAGNLTSVMKALRAVSAGKQVEVTEDPSVIAQAERIVLPGVGHFAATRRLDETGLTAAIREAIAQGKPFLGICVGMQWLLAGSEECTAQPGLGYFARQCLRFPGGAEKVPHVGWDTVRPADTAQTPRLLAGVGIGEMFYFTHSYYVPAETAVANETGLPPRAITRYIVPFSAAIEHRNVFGVQFHPEKSGPAGLQVLASFVGLPA